MEDIIETGCERILTSGQQPKAVDGARVIKELIARAADRIIIMPGSGVNAENIISIAENTGAKEFHSSAGLYTDSEMSYANPSMNESLKHVKVNIGEVKSMVELLKGYCK